MLFGSEGRTATNLIESKTINENGTYSAIYEIDPETGEVYDPPKDGYQTVVISLPIYNKRVALTTSDVTDSQTAIFEYDPQDETPNPWEGYSLFTIDLSGVKRDINDLLDQISALEDELEDCHDCWEEVVTALQRYDPDYDPAEGECPSDKVDEVVDKVGDLQDEVEACHDCKDAVVAAIQQYVPSFTPDPATCNIPDGVDDVYEQGKEDEATENPPGYTLPVGTDPNDPDIPKFTNGNPVTDKDLGVTIGMETYQNPDNSWGAGVYITKNGTTTHNWFVNGGTASSTDYFTDKIVQVNPTTGDWTASITVHWSISWWNPTTYTGSGQSNDLIGYGDTSHTYAVSNNT